MGDSIPTEGSARAVKGLARGLSVANLNSYRNTVKDLKTNIRTDYSLESIKKYIINYCSIVFIYIT